MTQGCRNRTSHDTGHLRCSIGCDTGDDQYRCDVAKQGHVVGLYGAGQTEGDGEAEAKEIEKDAQRL